MWLQHETHEMGPGLNRTPSTLFFIAQQRWLPDRPWDLL